MKTAILASLIASAAAFAPAKQAASSTAVKAFENELGAQLPLGFWDPLGLVADGDEATFERLRYTEIKHGRIAMLAIIGYLTTEAGIRLPGRIDFRGDDFADIPGGYAALETIPWWGNVQLIAFIGALEVFVMRDFAGVAEFPGDLRNGIPTLYDDWDKFSDEEKFRKRGIELNNGRAAQMGILGLMVHEQMGVSILPFGGGVADAYNF